MTTPITPISSHRASEKLPELKILCEFFNDRELGEDPEAPAEYQCLADLDVEFECKINW